jgi:alcohol dehydrogenase
MRALVCTRYARKMKDACCVMTDVPVARIEKPDDVLVKVHAAAINPVDCKIIQGKQRALHSRPFPNLTCFDFSGVVVEVGSEVTRICPGDEVFGDVKGLRCGAAAEFLVVDEDACSVKPKNITHAQAAAVPLAAQTALQCFEKGRLRRGGSVFVTGGPGGVGTFAVQIAKKMFEASTVGTTASTKKVDFCKSLGADFVVDYKQQDLQKELADKNQLWDVMVDCNNAASTLRPFVNPQGGALISITMAPTADVLKDFQDNLPGGEYSHRPTINRGVVWLANYCPRLIDACTGATWQRFGLKGSATYDHVITVSSHTCLDKILPYLERGEIVPQVDRVFALEDAAEAMQHVANGKAVGKVVIEVVAG